MSKRDHHEMVLLKVMPGRAPPSALCPRVAVWRCSAGEAHLQPACMGGAALLPHYTALVWLPPRRCTPLGVHYRRGWACTCCDRAAGGPVARQFVLAAVAYRLWRPTCLRLLHSRHFVVLHGATCSVSLPCGRPVFGLFPKCSAVHIAGESVRCSSREPESCRGSGLVQLGV